MWPKVVSAGALALAAAGALSGEPARGGDLAAMSRAGTAPDPARARPDTVESLLANLSVREKAAQLVMAWIPGGMEPGSPALRRAERLVSAEGVGGLIVGKGDRARTEASLRRLQRVSRVPVLAGSDLEWGTGMRLLGATLLPHAMAVGAAGDTALAYAHGRATAVEARAAGLHLTFSPVLDVNVDPRNPVINTRAFGEDPALVAALGSAVVRGLQDGGLIAVGKHFPGHGDTDRDSHVTLPTIGASVARLDSVELVPFRAAIAAGVGGLMVGHIAVPALTGERTPASLSPAITTTLLRRRLGFDGLAFTDALNMAGVGGGRGSGATAVRAVRAGADMLLQPPEPARAIDAIVAAVASGEIGRARLDSSVRRILRAKQRAGLLGAELSPAAGDGGRAEWITPPAEVADSIAARSITLLRDRIAVVPLQPGRPVVSLAYEGTGVPGGANAALDRELRSLGASLTSVRLPRSRALEIADSLVARWGGAPDAPVVIVSSYRQAIPWASTLGLPAPVAEAIERMARALPVVHIAFGDPYVIASAPSAGAMMLAWSGLPSAQRATARALAGVAAIGGRSPITIEPLFARGVGIARD